MDFAELVRDNQAMVFSLAYHFLRDRPGAEELAQDVFLQLHQSLEQLESPAHVRFWLRRVTSHRCIDESRRRRLRPRLSLEQAPEPAVFQNEGDFMLSATLQKLVATLPERARLVVILRYQEEMEPAQIADVLGIPIGTVKSQLHRSLALLRGKMTRTKQKAAV